VISAIILAADPKCDVVAEGPPYGRCTIVEEAVNNFLDSKVEEVILVLGSEETKIQRKIEDKPVKVVINPDYHQGLSSSIKVGLKAVSETAAAILIALGDQPLVKAEVINKIISQYLEKKEKGIVVPVHRGVRGHPTLFDIRYKEEIMNLGGNVGASGIIQRHKPDILEVEVDTASIISDIEADTDYLMQLRKFSLLDRE
jgi:molybdenum cofactor cytidylyltransferase